MILLKAEESGIIFIDEIDKIAGKESHGPDVSREECKEIYYQL